MEGKGKEQVWRERDETEVEVEKEEEDGGPERGLRTRRSEWTSPLGMFFWQSCRCRLLRSPGGVALIFFFRPRLIENSTERFTVFATGSPFVPGAHPLGRHLRIHLRSRSSRLPFRLVSFRLVSFRSAGTSLQSRRILPNDDRQSHE